MRLVIYIISTFILRFYYLNDIPPTQIQFVKILNQMIISQCPAAHQMRSNKDNLRSISSSGFLFSSFIATFLSTHALHPPFIHHTPLVHSIHTFSTHVLAYYYLRNIR